MAPPRIPLAERFWAKVERRGPDDCWPWLAGTDRKGYGRVRRPGAGNGFARASHVAWTLAHGPVPEGLWVLHRCDNPSCVNPAHLFVGTHQDNVDDKVAKKRHAFGERQSRAKLTDEAVREIRSRRAKGEGALRLAEQFGVSKKAVQLATRGDTWAHVEGGEMEPERTFRRGHVNRHGPTWRAEVRLGPLRLRRSGFPDEASAREWLVGELSVRGIDAEGRH